MENELTQIQKSIVAIHKDNRKAIARYRDLLKQLDKLGRAFNKAKKK